MSEIDSRREVCGGGVNAHLNLFFLADGRPLPLLASGSLVWAK